MKPLFLLWLMSGLAIILSGAILNTAKKTPHGLGMMYWALGEIFGTATAAKPALSVPVHLTTPANRPASHAPTAANT